MEPLLWSWDRGHTREGRFGFAFWVAYSTAIYREKVCGQVKIETTFNCIQIVVLPRCHSILGQLASMALVIIISSDLGCMITSFLDWCEKVGSATAALG